MKSSEHLKVSSSPKVPFSERAWGNRSFSHAAFGRMARLHIRNSEKLRASPVRGERISRKPLVGLRRATRHVIWRSGAPPR